MLYVIWLLFNNLIVRRRRRSRLAVLQAHAVHGAGDVPASASLAALWLRSVEARGLRGDRAHRLRGVARARLRTHRRRGVRGRQSVAHPASVTRGAGHERQRRRAAGPAPRAGRRRATRPRSSTPSAASTRWPPSARAPCCRPRRWTASPAACGRRPTGSARSATRGSSTRRPGPFYVEGAEPGDTLAVHFVSIEPREAWGVSTTVPFFGSLTATATTALLHQALPERTWFYEIDRAERLVRYAALDTPFTAALPLDPMHGTVGVAPALRRGPLLARARRLGRQHGHPGDAGRGHLLPRGQRRGRDVQLRRRARPAGRGRDLRRRRRVRDGHAWSSSTWSRACRTPWPRLESDDVRHDDRARPSRWRTPSGSPTSRWCAGWPS